MKRLIKRYVLKAQVDRENDEVNEGKRQHFQNSREFLFCLLGSITVVCGGFS